MSASTKSVARHTLPSHAATPGFCPQLAQNLVLSMKFTLSIAEGKETDSFPIFLIFWPSFSLAVLYIMLKRFPSQTRHNSAVNRHFTQTCFLAQIWCKKRHFLSSRPTICPSAVCRWPVWGSLPCPLPDGETNVVNSSLANMGDRLFNGNRGSHQDRRRANHHSFH